MRTVLGALLSAITVASQAVELEGKVVGVSDGDTITVLDASKTQHKIRLAGIDAPEKGQDFGQRSKESLSELVFAKQVRIEWTKEDRYGRKVAKVWVADTNCAAVSCPKTLDAGLAQITVGMAWWYRKYAREQSVEDQTRYGFAQTEAQERRAGLWRDAAAIPPWDWRSSRRATANWPQAAAPGRAAGSPRTALAASPSTVTSGSPSP
jgi:endonuclease YncB( thermonuclease family)